MKDKIEKKEWRNLAVDLAAIILLVTAGWVYTFGIEDAIDVDFYDETSYLAQGVRISMDGLPNVQMGPLYAVWYYGISLFQSDYVELYYLNYKLMTILPCLFLFILLRINNVEYVLSFLGATVFLLSNSNFPTWPKISHFALSVLLLGLIVASIFKMPRHQCMIVFIAALIASYIRPEFFVAASVLLIIFIYLFINGRAQLSWRNEGVIYIGTILTAGAMLLGLGVPLGGDRSIMAFGQHYAANWVQWNNDTRNPFINAGEIIQKDFGSVKTPIEAIIANPNAVIHHIISNIHGFLREFGWSFTCFFPHHDASRRGFKIALLIVLLVFFIMKVRKNPQYLISGFKDNLFHCKTLGICVLVLLIPVITSIILIYPRKHYVIFLTLLFVPLALCIFRSPQQKNLQICHKGLFACLILFVALKPLSQTVFHDQVNLKTIRFIHSMGLIKPVKILEIEGGIDVYLGKNYRWIPAYEKSEGFMSFIKNRGIDMILTSDALFRDSRFKNDVEWAAFIDAPESMGFVAKKVTGVPDRSVFIRRSLLE